MSGLRRQRRTFRERLWTFTGEEPLAELLERPGPPESSEVVYRVGPGYGVTELRRRAAEEPPPGWRAEGHYLSLPFPVFRYVHLETGRALEIHRAAAYFGEGDYSRELASAAFRLLGSLIRGSWNEGRILTTPATTGRYLIARSISGDREWPTLELETQELLRATSGQGRIEIFERGDRVGPLVEYDGRLAYGAHCRELPAGEPVRDQERDYAGPWAPGRYLVRFRVPKEWDHVGILPVRDDDRWRWPSAPGESGGPTWVDARELAIALRHGWRIEILERLLFPSPPYRPVRRHNGQLSKAGPLDRWAAKLCALRTEGNGAAGPLVSTAIRAILLFGIGALHGAPRRITHTIPRARAEEIPAHARDVRQLGDVMAWTELEPSRWPEMNHPEWTTAIWARARAALLDCSLPGGRRGGLLHVPARTAVAALTDAIYLTADPEWPDDGKVGRFRRVWSDQRVAPIPTSAADLRRRKAEVA